jgi:hypothetical protein
MAGGVLAKLQSNRQADELRQQGEAAYDQARREGAAVLGQQQAMMASSGFDVGSVSFQGLRLDQAEQVELDALTRRYEYLAAASRAKAQGNLALIAGAGQAAGVGLEGYTSGLFGSTAAAPVVSRGTRLAAAQRAGAGFGTFASASPGLSVP